MRKISENELKLIAGGDLNCIDFNTWQNIQDKAIRDATLFTVLTTSIAGAGIYGLTASVMTTGLVGIAFAPYAAIMGYFNSSAWNTFYTQQQ